MSSRDRTAGPEPAFAVVHDVCRRAPGSALLLELRGLRRDADAETFATRIAERHRRFQVTLESHGAGRHTLRLLPDGPDARGGSGGLGGDLLALTPELLSDLLGPYLGAGDPLALVGHQRELFLEAATDRGRPGRHLEQIHWNWSGPIDPTRFRAAWQSVSERESILRSAFDWTAVPRLVLHPRIAIGIVRRSRSGATWRELLEKDRLRGFALDRPPLLRLTLMEGEPGAPVRVLLTYHRALLDERGVHLLLREFYRAYLADGVLRGGERRPDLRDHARWLTEQSDEGARELWQRIAPPRHAVTAVGRGGEDTRQSGDGRLRRRLTEPHTSRLRAWAASSGAGESSALHVVWALLLYRAAGVEGPLHVSFGVHLSGRDIALPGAAGIPGLLGNPLPMTVRVDPAAPLSELLRQVRDALLDMAAYPWVCGERIREWAGRSDGEQLTRTTVSFGIPSGLPPALRAELRAQGVQVDEPRTASAATSLPLLVAAHHDHGGGLVLSAVYDRAGLADADASATLGQCLGLLRFLAGLPDAHTTVGQALDLLADAEVPSIAPRPPEPRSATVRTLRDGAPEAGVICLLEVPGVVDGAYGLLARRHQGPETIVALRWEGPSGSAVAAGALTDALTIALGRLDSGRAMVLAGCGPGAAAAYDVARGLAHRGHGSVTVVMTGAAGPESSASALAEGLCAVPAGRP